MLIRDVMVLDPSFKVLEHMDVQVEEGRFASIAPAAQKREDGKNFLLMPGFYNTHCHVPMTLVRGLGEGLCLSDWLTKRMFPFEDHLTAEDCYYGALLGIMELVSSGCVSISDMYFHILDIARAFDDAGMKGNICHGISSQDPDQDPEALKGWKDTLKLMEQVKDRKDGRIKVDMGLHAEYTSTPKLMRAVAAKAAENGMIIHTHISETKKEHEECKERWGGLTPVQLMKQNGIFDNPVVGAHGVWLEEEDVKILSQSKATVSHCISSNLKLGSGVAPVNHYMEEGINVVIATDGAASNNNLNLMEEIHLASLAAKGTFLDPGLLPPAQVLKMATVNGAKAQGRLDCGVIEEGARADFILLDLDKPHLVPTHNLLANLVYSAQSSDLYMTVIDGKVVYKDGEFPTIDRERVIYEAKKRVDRILGELQWK